MGSLVQKPTIIEVYYEDETYFVPINKSDINMKDIKEEVWKQFLLQVSKKDGVNLGNGDKKFFGDKMEWFTLDAGTKRALRIVTSKLSRDLGQGSNTVVA